MLIMVLIASCSPWSGGVRGTAAAVIDICGGGTFTTSGREYTATTCTIPPGSALTFGVDGGVLRDVRISFVRVTAQKKN